MLPVPDLAVEEFIEEVNLFYPNIIILVVLKNAVSHANFACLSLLARSSSKEMRNFFKG